MRLVLAHRLYDDVVLVSVADDAVPLVLSLQSFVFPIVNILALVVVYLWNIRSDPLPYGFEELEVNLQPLQHVVDWLDARVAADKIDDLRAYFDVSIFDWLCWRLFKQNVVY